MTLHPDIIDAMVAAGASTGMNPGAVLAMVQAACRAAWNVGQASRNNETPDEALKRLSPAHPQPSTARVRKHRAAKAMKHQSVSTGVSPDASLSLKESLYLVEKDGTVNCGNSAQEPFAMTPQWQPNEKSRASLNELLGETGAGILLDKFRDIQEASGRAMTDAEWNARLRAWARDERKPFQGAQMNLPLMRVASARAGPASTVWRLQRAIEETLQRRESG